MSAACPTLQLSDEQQHEALVAGLAAGRVVWHHTLWDDGLFYLANEHSLLSIAMGHFCHPLRAADRVARLACVAAQALLFSALVSGVSPLGARAVAAAVATARPRRIPKVRIPRVRGDVNEIRISRVSIRRDGIQ